MSVVERVRQRYEAGRLKRLHSAGKRFPPLPPKPLTGRTWAPKMTEAERKAHEQYVIDNNLPF